MCLCASKSNYGILEAILMRHDQSHDRVLHAAKTYHMSALAATRKFLKCAGHEAAGALVRCVDLLGFVIVQPHCQVPVPGLSIQTNPFFQWPHEGIVQFAIEFGVARGADRGYDRPLASRPPDNERVVLGGVLAGPRHRLPAQNQR